MSSSGSSIWSMAVEDMCKACANLYTGNKSCMLGVTQAEREQRAATGKCGDATQTRQESGHTLKVVGSMVLNATTGLWKFKRS